MLNTAQDKTDENKNKFILDNSASTDDEIIKSLHFYCDVELEETNIISLTKDLVPKLLSLWKQKENNKDINSLIPAILLKILRFVSEPTMEQQSDVTIFLVNKYKYNTEH